MGNKLLVTSESAPRHIVKKRQPELDFLRCIAVVSVVLCHIDKLRGRNRLPHLGQAIVNVLQDTGWMGVDLFFVLSGFLIAGLLFREQMEHHEIRIGRFFIRRGLKIYPAFYLLIAVTLIRDWFGDIPIKPDHLAAECFFYQNYHPPLWGHTWTLAIEEHFYLLLPILLLCLMRFSRNPRDPFRLLPRIFAGLSIAVLLARVLTILADTEPYFRTYKSTHCRIDSLMFGVLLSYYWNYHTQRLQSFVERHVDLLLFLAVLCFAVVTLVCNLWWTDIVGFSLIWFGWGCVLLAFCCNPQGKLVPPWLLNRCAFIGQYSYSIYLWHGAVLFWGEQFLEAAGIRLGFSIRAALYVTLTFSLGIILSRIVEYPVLKLRDRLFPSRSGAPSLPQWRAVQN